MKNSVLRIIMIFALLFLSSSAALAADFQSSKKASDAMWRAVEGCFNLSPEYKRGNSTFESTVQKSFWRLTWENSKRNAVAYAEIDANTQIISSFHRYDNYYYGYKIRLPVISKESARKTAEKAINTLDPYKLKNSRLSNATSADFADQYTFTWTRVAFGIPYPENAVSIVIDGQTGKISSYNSKWDYDLAFPAPNLKIDATSARKNLLHSLVLGVEYTEEWSPKGMKTILAYTIPYNYRELKVNALNDLILPKALKKSTLTAIYKNILWTNAFEVKPIVSKDNLLERVYPYIPFDKGYKLERVSNHKSSESSWNVQYSKMQENIYFIINYTFSENGQLLHYFNSGEWPKSAKYTREQCLQKALEYLGEYYTFSDKEQLYLLNPPDLANKSPIQHFTFVRKVNGYPHRNNSINIEVSAEDLTLRSYSASIPKKLSPPSSLKADWEVLKDLIPEDGMKLQYVSKRNKDKKEIFLVYLPTWKYTKPIPAEKLTITTKNTPAKKKAIIHLYEDMKNKPGEDIVNNLTNQGILRSYAGSKFKPNAYISKAEFTDMVVRMLVAKGKVNPYEIKIKKKIFKDVASDKWYYVPVYLAYQSNLLPQTSVYTPNKKITKEEMAFILAKALGYSKLTISDKEFLLMYSDSKDITPAYAGEVIVADKLGLLKGGENYFPKKYYTKLEAAKIISKALKLQ